MFLTTTLRSLPHGDAMARVLAAALAAVEPAAAVRRFLRLEDETLLVGEQRYDLSQIERIFLVSVGKAGAPMATAAAEVLGQRLTEGVVVVKAAVGSQQPALSEGEGLAFSLEAAARQVVNCQLLAASHPLPDERSVAAAQHVAALLAKATERDLVLVLISGGGSALMSLPAPGVGLADMQRLTGLLLGCGATINEINCLRKHLDMVKGGGLARLAAPAPVATLILSDVVGNPLDVIASGPTVPDSSSFADAWAVLKRYGLVEQAPLPIVARLQAGLQGGEADTPKPGDPLFGAVQNVLVGSNIQAANAALARATGEGFHALLLTTYAQGEARVVGQLLAAIARQMVETGQPLARPACLVLGGETTVTLRGNGKGGRNQELALAAVAELSGLPNVALVTLASDGGDGPTDAAGAVVTGETLARATALGLNPGTALANNDAYPFFALLGDLLKTGPTDTNVNDLAFVFVW
ncbi:MAG: DUF4147 domain-containing protein [Chloroflexaceae bacterium]|nr:DUF4147 domain-containing protein [Chloroflexaceae bacterium]